MSSWTGELVKELSISYGVVRRSEAPELDMKELLELADKRMYEDKENHYKSKGIDRRGQQSAYDTLCSLYAKILLVNLTADSFHVIQMDQKERTAEKGYHESISAWLHEFGLSGQVHPDDREEYLRRTSLDYLRDYFRNGGRSYSLHYRRLTEDVFHPVIMEMVPSKDYTDENQTIYLYVKSID